jgi:hypothetical protein
MEPWGTPTFIVFHSVSVISKCMERCVYKYVHNVVLLNNIITSNQSGFTFGDSAINQLVNISND